MEYTGTRRHGALCVGAIICVVLLQVCSATGNYQAALMNDLFSNYEGTVRPVCGEDRPIVVKIGLAVRQIIELDEPKQILYLNAWIRLVWTDCQLRWDPAQYGNITHLIRPYKYVWTPDITLYDNAVGETPGQADYRANFYSDGTVYYNFPTVISVMCKMDVTYFPFDVQNCPLIFGSWSYHGLELDLTNRSGSGDISSFVPNSEFDITGLPLKRHVFVYGCCPEPFPDVTFYVQLKRKPMFYVTNLLFPCLVITSVALLGFMLPPDSGEKVSLEITVLLSLAVFLLVVSESLPPTSETFPYIGIYFACAIVLVSLSTVLTVLVLNVHHTTYRPLPSWMRTVFLGYMAKLVFFKDDSAKRPRRALIARHEYVAPADFVASGSAEAKGFGEKTEFLNVNGVTQGLSNMPGEETRNFEGQSYAQLSDLAEILREQLRLLKKSEDRNDSEDFHDVQCIDWKNVAIVLDRFFLVIFLLTVTITSLIVLVPLVLEGEKSGP